MKKKVKILPMHGDQEFPSLEALWDMSKKDKNRDSRTNNNETISSSKL